MKKVNKKLKKMSKFVKIVIQFTLMYKDFMKSIFDQET